MCAKKDILTTLTYFDLFRYPLTQTEIFFFLKNQYKQEEFVPALHALIREEQVFRLDEFFSLQNDYKLVARRRAGNLKASRMLDQAEGIAAFLSSFPFVRGVAVSGSLSKNFADEKSDIDFFIITAKNRLWLARTAMHLFKKFTYLFGKQHLFCMNYYVDEEGLQIREQNIYTAIELATLMPLRGIAAFRDLYKDNAWERHFLPNYAMKIAYTKEAKNTLLKTILEACLNNALGNAIDVLLMKMTIGRWAKKTAHGRLNANGNLMSMDAGKHYAKPDPRSFQHKFLQRYEQAVRSVLHQYQKQLKPVT